MIELATALVRTQSLSDIFVSMAHPADSLDAKRRDLYDHQRSVVASLEWSRRFLTATEIDLLGAVSVFTGGFTSATARFVGAIDDESALVGLVDHSMVQFDRSNGRYRVLEPIRADSQDRLSSQEANALNERHLLWCEALAQEIGEAMFEADPERTFPYYDNELTNLGSGLRRSWQVGDRDRFCRILAPMANWWVHRARPEGVEEWADLLTDETRTPIQIMSISLALSYYWGHQGQHQRSIDYAVLARGKAQAVGDTTNECATLISEGHAGVRSAAQDGMDALPRTVPSTVASVDAEPLTGRELSVAFLLRGDLTQREIADELYIAASTVKTHTKSIYRKLGVRKRSHAIARAMELGLFER